MPLLQNVSLPSDDWLFCSETKDHLRIACSIQNQFELDHEMNLEGLRLNGLRLRWYHFDSCQSCDQPYPISNLSDVTFALTA